MNYLDFELEIGLGVGREYPVAVVRSPAGEARETMRFPFDTLALESRLKDLQIALLRSGGKSRKIPLPEEHAVQDFGRALFDAVFIGEVRSRYDMSSREAAQKDVGLRLKLRIQSPQLAALPWEFLYDPRQAEYVCLSRNTPIVRYLEIPQHIQTLTVAPPLRILGMAVSPDDPHLMQLDLTHEKQRVEEATKHLRERGLLELHWLEGQTWRDLQKAMRAADPWHIFHFIGHGGFDKHTDEGLIYLANEDGESERLTATNLGRLLSDHRSLRLVVLNACEGGRGSDLDLFSSTAAILVRRGLPAVLAMQYEITDHAAIEFSRAFYDVLAEGMAIDTAVVEARKAVSFAVSNTIEWGTPVLYMRSPDGKIFDVAQIKAAAPKPKQTVETEAPVAPKTTPKAKPKLEKEKPVAPKSELKRKTTVQLRSQPLDILSDDDVVNMLQERDFFDKNNNAQGKGLQHQYEVTTRDGKKLVIDHTTGLTWQQSGSPNSLTYVDAEAYIRDLNHQRFAGYSDWRLPTLDEAMSLMEQESKNDDLYIDSIFDKTQRWIWTVDKEKVGVAWVVKFRGYCAYNGLGDGKTVRAVRSGQPNLIAKPNLDENEPVEQKRELKRKPTVHLRSQPLNSLSDDEVENMLIERDFFDKNKNTQGIGLQHQYEVIVRDEENVVIDHVTGLTWQRFGSPNYITYPEAKMHIRDLNRQRFAGYNDWRLPTLEEAMSIMERKTKGGASYYSDPIFDNTQVGIWTADQYDVRSRSAWCVGFYSGYCYRGDNAYVRAVRSGQSTL